MNMIAFDSIMKLFISIKNEPVFSSTILKNKDTVKVITVKNTRDRTVLYITFDK